MKKYKKIFKEYDTTKSVLGSGMIDIYRSSFKDSLAYFKKENRIYIAKDLEDAKKKEEKGEKVALIIKGPKDVLWCIPVINGEPKIGMSSGSFVFTSNGVVMKNYMHPIRLMDRFEK